MMGGAQNSQDETEKLRSLLALHETAIGLMSHGFCLFGADERLIVCNDQYRQILGLDPAIVRPGISFRDILVHSLSVGNHRGLQVDQVYDRRMAMVRQRTAAKDQIVMDDGRLIELTVRPVEGGGWV